MAWNQALRLCHRRIFPCNTCTQSSQWKLAQILALSTQIKLDGKYEKKGWWNGQEYEGKEPPPQLRYLEENTINYIGMFS